MTGSSATFFEDSHFFATELAEWEVIARTEEHKYRTVIAFSATVLNENYQPVFCSVIDAVVTS